MVTHEDIAGMNQFALETSLGMNLSLKARRLIDQDTMA